MNYPFWVVPVIGSGWIIGIVAIIHIMISHFAVGGGFYLVLAERRAVRTGRKDWLEYIKAHSRFFLLLTVVAGAMTGVGIWFSIGLTSPEATSALIHNFVLGWAAEWTFFLVEIAAILIYYQTWNKISQKRHIAIGWVYAAAAWLSLFIINGILTFMLYPGETWLQSAGTGMEASRFWAAFFNPTFFPSLVLRTLISLNLAGIFALITGSRLKQKNQSDLKEEIVRWSARWLMPAFVLLPFAAIWYFYSVPRANRQLFKLGVSTIGQGVFTALTREAVFAVIASLIVFILVYLLAWRQPKELTFAQAMIILFMALAVTGVTEHMREMLRKPYVIGKYMYANGVRVTERDRFNTGGYLANTIWATPLEKEEWRQLDEAQSTVLQSRQSDQGSALLPINKTQSEAVQGTTEQIINKNRLRNIRGELMFRGQCMTCHTVSGYRSMKRLLAGRNAESIGSILKMLHEYKDDSIYKAFMPPLVGTAGEIEALSEYLLKLSDKNTK